MRLNNKIKSKKINKKMINFPNMVNQQQGPDILNSRYRILKKIGSGSFGRVFMAEDLQTNKKVAIKQVTKSLLEGSP